MKKLSQNITDAECCALFRQSVQVYEELMHHLQTLDTMHRVVFNLFVIDGFSHAEIAGMLGISAEDSRANLSAAKKQLRKILKSMHEEVAARYN
jgi:RNA polymerase sigma-70 factor (ECF subfamily)